MPTIYCCRSYSPSYLVAHKLTTEYMAINRNTLINNTVSFTVSLNAPDVIFEDLLNELQFLTTSFCVEKLPCTQLSEMK